MSNQPKKPSGMHSDRLYLLIEKVAGALQLDASVVADQLEAVFAKDEFHPSYNAIKSGKDPYHNVCGSLCDFTLHTVPGSPGRFHFGVVCPKCLRPLMEGEITYVSHSG